MAIQIRAVEEHDYPALAEIYAFESVIEQTTQLPYGNIDFWKKLYPSKSDTSIELAALFDGTLCGHLGILLNRQPRRKHVASFGLAVHPGYQSKGVGTALLQELIRLADNWLNLVKLELSVFIDNERAIRLYRKLGFVIEGESKYDVFKQGRYSHGYRMARYHPKQSPD